MVFLILEEALEDEDEVLDEGFSDMGVARVVDG